MGNVYLGGNEIPKYHIGIHVYKSETMLIGTIFLTIFFISLLYFWTSFRKTDFIVMDKSKFSIKIVNIILLGMGSDSRLAPKGHIVI